MKRRNNKKKWCFLATLIVASNQLIYANIDGDNQGIVPTEVEYEKVLGEVAEGEVAEGEVAEGEVAEGEVAEGEVAEGEVAEGEVAEGEVAEGEVAEGEVAEGEVAEGEVAEGEVAEGEVAEQEVSEEKNLQQQVEVEQQEESILIETISIQDTQELLVSEDVDAIISNGEYANVAQQISDQLYAGITNLQSTIYLSNYGLDTRTLINYLGDAIFEAKNMLPTICGNQLSIMQQGNVYTIECSEGVISNISVYDDCTLKIEYNDKATLSRNINELQAAIEPILAKCADAESDMQKALIIHDYLILNCKYDTSGNRGMESYSAYGTLVNKTSVCQGYAYAMKLLLRKEGIPCDVVTGGDHAWNIVNIEGENYYIDATWDDPIPDQGERIIRTHFAVTNQQLAASGHQWNTSDYPECTSEKYAFLQTATEALYTKGVWYYLSSPEGYYGDYNLYLHNENKQQDELLIEGPCSNIEFEQGKKGIYYDDAYGERKYYKLYREADKLAPLVNRFYMACLGREGDEGGIQYWTEQLNQGKQTGAQLAENFICSEEFKDKQLSNEDYVKVLYQAFFGRTDDQGGMNYWVSVLETGKSRQYILSNLVQSDEYTILCKEYNIEKGNVVLTKPADCYTQLADFVHRIYAKALNRNPDEDGINYWVGELALGRLSGREVAQIFLTSNEFIDKNIGQEAFVQTLYEISFNRSGNSQEITFWTGCLNRGITKKEIIHEFLNSKDFERICKAYNIRF